jgi:transposase
VAVADLRRKRQQVSAFLLRQGLHYPGERAWTKAHRDWLASQKLEYAEHRIAFEEMLLAMRQAQERIERLGQAIRMAVPDWSLRQGTSEQKRPAKVAMAKAVVCIPLHFTPRSRVDLPLELPR